MGQPYRDYVSFLNEQNYELKPLTSRMVLHRITRQLQCNYWVTELGKCGCMWFQCPLMIRNVQNVISYKVKYEYQSHVVPV